MFGRGNLPGLIIFVLPPVHFNPADDKKWVRLLALPLQLSCVGFFRFLFFFIY